MYPMKKNVNATRLIGGKTRWRSGMAVKITI